jgi:hypothetical protein
MARAVRHARKTRHAPAVLRHDGAVGRGSVAPRVLDPILAVAERVDRWVRRITPIRPGSVLAIERRRYRGAAVTLGDGTVVRRGDRADIVHFDNRRLRELAGRWQSAGFRQARADFAALAAGRSAMDLRDRPVAYHGATILAPFAVRLGFEVRPRSRSLWHRFEDWYLRSLLARWAPAGRGRLRAGHGDLAVDEVWVSAAELERRFGQ